MANMLVIFGLVTYSTKGVSFGGIEQSIPGKIIPKVGGFPTIILWAVAAVVIVWFIWNKTKFGKNLYAVGGNPEALLYLVFQCLRSLLEPLLWQESYTDLVLG